MISDEAIRAAWEAFCANGDDDMQAALEAAAPHMQAVARGEAWEEGYFAGAYTNPYRSQA